MDTVYIITLIAVLLLIFIKLHRKRKNRKRIILVDENNCTGCRRCAKRCSRRVLEMVEDGNGIHAAVKHPDRCTGCGDCLGKCKFNALKMVKRI